METIGIRKCALEELPLVQQIEQEVYADCVNKGIFSLLSDGEFLTRINYPNFIFGCFNNHCLMGYIIYKVPDEEELLHFEITAYGHNKNDTVILDGLAVLPCFRGQGLQKRMIAYFEVEAKRFAKSNIVATVHPDNIYCLNNFLDLGYSVLKEKLMPYGSRYLIDKRF